MSEETLRNDLQEEQRVAEEVNVEEIVKKLKEQGLSYDEILAEIERLLKEGKITEEDFEKAKAVLESGEKEEASSLFGVDIM